MSMNPLPDPRASDRLVALHCAMQLAPDSVVESGAAEAGEVTSLARTIEQWISEAKDDQDRQYRRAVVLMICDKSAKNTPMGRIKALARELHHYLTRR